MRKNLAALLATVVGAIVLLAGWKIHSDATDHLAGTRILGGFNVGVPANPRQFIAELGRMMGRLGEDVVIFNMPVDVKTPVFVLESNDFFGREGFGRDSGVILRPSNSTCYDNVVLVREFEVGGNRVNRSIVVDVDGQPFGRGIPAVEDSRVNIIGSDFAGRNKLGLHVNAWNIQERPLNFISVVGIDVVGELHRAQLEGGNDSVNSSYERDNASRSSGGMIWATKAEVQDAPDSFHVFPFGALLVATGSALVVFAVLFLNGVLSALSDKRFFAATCLLVVCISTWGGGAVLLAIGLMKLGLLA